jgi:hypothetical protein
LLPPVRMAVAIWSMFSAYIRIAELLIRFFPFMFFVRDHP